MKAEHDESNRQQSPKKQTLDGESPGLSRYPRRDHGGGKLGRGHLAGDTRITLFNDQGQ
jgi:hypothetical protein